MEFAFVYSQNYMPYSNVIPLPTNSSEFKRLYKLMQGEYLIQINNIFLVNNPYLYEKFYIKYNECKSWNKNVKILELFHCTHVNNVPSIIENNFDWRRVRRVKYGQGVSFSPYPDYANLHSCFGNEIYADNGTGVIKAMFVVDVIVGKKQLGNKFIVVPNWPIDTTVSEDESVFVKYFDHEFYPKYVIYYVTYPVVSVNGQRCLYKY